MPKPFYITTSIPYVNAIPHVGHAAEFVLTDIIARYHRALEDTYALSGTDENAMKNVQAAEKAGISVKELVQQNSEAFRKLSDSDTLNFSFDQFIRTTESKHFGGAQKLWSLIHEKDPDAIYKKSYEGLYCVGCEEFKREKDLVDGKCPEHDMKPELVKEENWFFALNKYADDVKSALETGQLQIFPEFRKNEVLAFLESGAEDISISRSRERAKGWGVPVPEDADQIMYVWIDALSNYITALDFVSDGELYQKYWEGDGERVHVIGKGILRFHAVYWPALLLAAELPLPTKIFSHEYLTINNQKISKTLGNVINPEEMVERYGTDGARYLLVSMLPYSNDGDISWEKMDEKYNADLANGLGNLVSRVMKLSENLETLPALPEDVSRPVQPVDTSIREYRISEALDSVWIFVSEANKFMDERKPWIQTKENPVAFQKTMEELFERINFIAVDLVPFLPETAEKIKTALKTGKVEPLFKRIT